MIYTGNTNNQNTENKICENCKKNDVCMYTSKLIEAVSDINKISERPNVFIKTKIECTYWLGEINENLIRNK